MLGNMIAAFIGGFIVIFLVALSTFRGKLSAAVFAAILSGLGIATFFLPLPASRGEFIRWLILAFGVVFCAIYRWVVKGEGR